MANIVNQTKSKIKQYLKDTYGKQYKDIVQEFDGEWVVRRGSAAVHVYVLPLHKDECLVKAMAYVVQDAKIGPKVLQHLMRQNANTLMGAYGLLFDDTITYSHTIAGANLDANELRTTIATVAFVADESDDHIRKMAGGLRAVDANASIIGLAELPIPVAQAKKPAAKKATPAPKAAPKPLAKPKAAPKKAAPKKK